MHPEWTNERPPSRGVSIDKIREALKDFGANASIPDSPRLEPGKAFDVVRRYSEAMEGAKNSTEEQRIEALASALQKAFVPEMERLPYAEFCFFFFGQLDDINRAELERRQAALAPPLPDQESTPAKRPKPGEESHWWTY